MMTVTPEWLPFEHQLERTLLGELVRQRRRFLKPLPYEAGPSVALASALLLDVGDVPVPLLLEATSAAGHRTPQAGDRRTALTSKPWIWRPGEALAMPALPPALSERNSSSGQPTPETDHPRNACHRGNPVRA